MVRKISLTADASCGPDEAEQQTHWPWNHKTEGTATDYKDLQDATEIQRGKEDQDYIDHYYEQNAARRWRHRQNRRLRLWEAEERVAMSSQDFDAAGFLKPRPYKRARFEQDMGSRDMPTNAQTACIDKTPLSTFILNKASELDSKWSQNWEWNTFDDYYGWDHSSSNPTSAGSQAKNNTVQDVWKTIPDFWIHQAVTSPPQDSIPQQFIERVHPKSRVFGHSRLTPKLIQRPASSWSSSPDDAKPPYGIQLIEDYMKQRNAFSTLFGAGNRT